jgi:nitroreductase
MNFKDLISKRESCRKYADRPLEREKIDACIEAARLGPSACNSQPWRFIVVDDKEMVKKLAGCLYDERMSFNRFCEDAAALIVLVQVKRQLSPRSEEILQKQDMTSIDIGIATQNICLAATELGIGTCIIGWFHGEKVKALLGIPEQFTPRIVISMGYPQSENTREKIRLEWNDLVSYNRY